MIILVMMIIVIVVDYDDGGGGGVVERSSNVDDGRDLLHYSHQSIITSLILLYYRCYWMPVHRKIYQIDWDGLPYMRHASTTAWRPLRPCF